MADTGYIQVSGKLADGFIGVINGTDYVDFVAKCIEALGADQADQVIEKLAKAILGDPASVARNSTYANGQFSPKADIPMTPVEVAAALGGSPVTTTGHLCKHGEPARFVPAGTSKASGKPYKAFYACARSKDEQCDFRANG